MALAGGVRSFGFTTGLRYTHRVTSEPPRGPVQGREEEQGSEGLRPREPDSGVARLASARPAVVRASLAPPRPAPSDAGSRQETGTLQEAADVGEADGAAGSESAQESAGAAGSDGAAESGGTGASAGAGGPPLLAPPVSRAEAAGEVAGAAQLPAPGSGSEPPSSEWPRESAPVSSGPAQLGRVTGDLNEPRGPDVLLRVDVPAAWLQQGVTVEIELPRLLSCARCDGGGCDACGRRGAFSRQDCHGSDESVELTLPGGGGEAAVALRIPNRGACAPAGSSLPAGHLLLTFRPDPTLATSALLPNVRRVRSIVGPVPLSLAGPVAVVILGALGLALLLRWILQ